MKKIAFYLLASCLSMTLIPLQLNATTTVEDPITTPATKPAESEISAEAKTLILRLDEIKAMDKSELDASEKKDLRKEVKSIKHEIQSPGGGLYISGGAIILILILIILL